MLKKIFDTSTLPITFYAHTLQFIDRSSYDKRCAVMFEAIMKDQIEMFVSGKLPPKLPPIAEQSVCFASLWSVFEQNGIDGAKFISEKGTYLVEVPNAELDLLLLSFADAKEIENARNDWWEITVCAPQNAPKEEKVDACILCVTGFRAAEGELPFTIKPVSKEKERVLYALYTPYPDDTTENMGKADNDVESVGAITQHTVFGEVDIMCVGAALCCCLTDLARNAVGYFDLGAESVYSSRMLHSSNPANFAARQTQMQNACQAIENDLVNIPGLTIIISHWHTDHVQTLNDMVNNPQSANFWANAIIYAPGIILKSGWAVTHFTRVQAAMRNARNLRFFQRAYVNTDTNVRAAFLFANPMVYKCDRNDTHLRNPNHHDHGIYAVLTLTSGSTVFLAGDCAYDTVAMSNPAHVIIDNGGAGYDALVVSHHGGKYSHTNAANRAQYIPLPSGHVNSVAVYSANGVAYGHPKPGNIADYTARGVGWLGLFTHQLPPGNDCIIIN